MASNAPANPPYCHDLHNNREDSEARDQRQVDAILADIGFAAESLSNQYTYKTIANHALRSPLREPGQRAKAEVSKAMSRSMCKKLAPWLNQAALNLYLGLSRRADDVRQDLLENANTLGFQEGYAPYVLYPRREETDQEAGKDQGAEDKIPLEYWQICPYRHIERIEGHNMIEDGGDDATGAFSPHHLVIQRSRSIEDRRLGYFVINSGLLGLRIHGEPVAPNCIAGPLPRFSIIQHGEKAFFFFRDMSDLTAGEGASNTTTRLQSSKRKSPLDDVVDEDRVVKKQKVARKNSRKLKLIGHSANCRRRGPKKTLPKASAAKSVPVENQQSQISAPPAIIEGDTTAPSHTSHPAHFTHEEPAGAPTPSSHNVLPSHTAALSHAVSPAQQSGPLIQPASLAQPDASAQSNPSSQPALSTQPASSTQSAPTLQPVVPTPVPFSTWEQAFQRGLIRCQNHPPKRSFFDLDSGKAQPVHKEDLIEAEDVDRTIASIWIALRENSSHEFAYMASLDSLPIQSEMTRGFVSIGRSNTLIMPLLLGSTKLNILHGEEVGTEEPVPDADDLPRNFQIQPPKAPSSATAVSSTEEPYRPDDGMSSHFVLAVARRSSPASAIRMEFYDSRPGIEPANLIRRVARNIVRNSAWLGNQWPTFGDASNESWINVRQQLAPTCGYHVIFNAWAVMLNIDVRGDKKRSDDESFGQLAKQVTDLANQGQLDTELVVAFMQHTGLASPESVGHWYQQTARTMPGAKMTSNGLQSVVMASIFHRSYASSLRAESLRDNQDSDTNGDSHPGDASHPGDNGGGSGGEGKGFEAGSENGDEALEGENGGEGDGGVQVEGEKGGENENYDDLLLPSSDDESDTDQSTVAGEESPT